MMACVILDGQHRFCSGVILCHDFGRKKSRQF